MWGETRQTKRKCNLITFFFQFLKGLKTPQGISILKFNYFQLWFLHKIDLRISCLRNYNNLIFKPYNVVFPLKWSNLGFKRFRCESGIPSLREVSLAMTLTFPLKLEELELERFSLSYKCYVGKKNFYHLLTVFSPNINLIVKNS